MEWLVDRMIEESACIVMAGEPKRSIKTWILCELVHAIASGRAVFNRFKTVESMRPTFLLAIEDDDFSVRARTEAISRGVGQGGEALRALPMYVRGRPVSIDLADRSQAISLARKIAEYGKENGESALICIDTLARANKSANENSAQEMTVVWDNVTRIRDITGAAVIVTHHLNKPTGAKEGDSRSIGNRLRGSSSIWGATEGLIGINPISFRESANGEALWTCEITTIAKTGNAAPKFTVELYAALGPDGRAKKAMWRVM